MYWRNENKKTTYFYVVHKCPKNLPNQACTDHNHTNRSIYLKKKLSNFEEPEYPCLVKTKNLKSLQT